MLNIIWLSMVLLSVVVAFFMGRVDELVQAVTDSAKLGFEIALGLTGIMTLWLGLMHVASESGLVDRFAKLLRPVMRRLFPEVPVEDPAMGAMSMNIAANVLGLANAATPFGLRAMKELQRLNEHVHTASNAMCMFLAINTSSVQLIPATAIAYLAANGALQPSSVIISSLIATSCSTIVAIFLALYFSKLKFYQIKQEDSI